MSNLPTPPKAYQKFVTRYPKLSTAWESINDAGKDGPLDAKTARLIKLAVSIGAMKEGPVHAGVRKSLAMGISRDEIEQVVALSAGTLGMPSTVAAFSWVSDVLEAKG